MNKQANNYSMSRISFDDGQILIQRKNTARFYSRLSNWLCEPKPAKECKLMFLRFFIFILILVLLSASLFAQQPSRDAQLLDLYRQRVAILEQQNTALLQANEASKAIIQSQQETIKMWENRSAGKMTKTEKVTFVLMIAGVVVSAIGAAK